MSASPASPSATAPPVGAQPGLRCGDDADTVAIQLNGTLSDGLHVSRFSAPVGALP